MAPLWIDIAKKEIGNKEITGGKDNPRILEYHSTTLLKAKHDEVPWCSAFVNWVISQTGLKGTGSASARSWLKWGKGIAEPAVGAITVIWRTSPKSWEGHVGFYLGPDPNDKSRILVLGGNQKDRVSIASYETSRVLGYRWPSVNEAV